MTEATYSLQNLARKLPERLAQYLEAQYHIWDESLVRERRLLIDEEGVTAHQPFIEATPAYLPGDPYNHLGLPSVVADLLVMAAKDPATGIPAVPYRHQAMALRHYFLLEHELVVSTGTGSGKTESFLMPILGSLAVERSLRPDSYAQPATRAILLYPMNALVNDQMARLRRLFGAGPIADSLLRPDGFRATFGMYTSRTPYPGPHDIARTREVVGGWIAAFFTKYAAQQKRLEAEGKWPAKDLAAFANGFQTSTQDSELLTRHEMHQRPPDLLVTNYSMLEYMLLRPVDAPIFRRTRDWLERNTENQLTVVLDEAHLYQGAQGTEVALLLRRLVSRLRIPRERVRFILTSASLAAGAGAEEAIGQFAAQLTGADEGAHRFAVIRGEVDRPAGGRIANSREAEAFQNLDINAVLNVERDLANADQQLRTLARGLGIEFAGNRSTEQELRDATFQLIQGHPVAAALVNAVMGSPTPLADLSRAIFPQAQEPVASLDGLLAVCAFARRIADGRVFLPSRAHFLFRGLDGVYACINPHCTARRVSTPAAILGRLYARPTLRCSCGSRVYELLTHRDCGAAYLRGYFKAPAADFLWHEPSTGLSGEIQALSEIHLLVEHERDQLGCNRVWLHRTTGQLEHREPTQKESYLELREPTAAPVNIRGRAVWTFDRQCPVCLGRWRDPSRPKIMDLVTKGEEPFAYLIASQVQLQATTKMTARQTPNGGRKSLLFSDGRQKAARLARDVPRVIERDAFREALLLAVHQLVALSIEPRVSDGFLYAAFVAVTGSKNLRFFDGQAADQLRSDEETFARLFGADLRTAISDAWQARAPAAFRVHILRTLGSAHYSLYALGLGYVQARSRVMEGLKKDLASSGLSEADVSALAIVWIQGLLEEFALYSPTTANRRIRELAAGYPVTTAGHRSGFTRNQVDFLSSEIDVPTFEAALKRSLTIPGDAPEFRVLNEDLICIVPRLQGTWYRCRACTYLAPVTWRGRCAACGLDRVIEVDPAQDAYLRARKAFWRDPVERSLNGQSTPMILDVQEHTAQLGYRDLGDFEATTESYERRFRDILLPDEVAIDVLSCTTTMEVGIDIGSLIAVGLRNMPPSRHNYQQRAGRAGRRGSAVSTVITYAQNNPHDAYLFDNPERLIAGQPTLMGLDVNNPVLARRHVYAELLQEYFATAVLKRTRGSVFAALGQTLPFFLGTGDGTLTQLDMWLQTDADAAATLERIRHWLPPGTTLASQDLGAMLVTRLRELQAEPMNALPAGEEEFIEFLFARGVLPAYAFPRDLITLQIERLDASGQVEVVERPQQGAHVALSEYAPGRLVVVNKNTYRIAAVTANTTPETVDRARSLFNRPAEYLQCPNCLFTAETTAAYTAGSSCPVCAAADIQHVTAIQPQMVWAEYGRAVDELDDDQTITETTVAQLPVPASERAFESREPFGSCSVLSHGRRVPLIIMNRGELATGGPTGFQVCELCGHTVLGGDPFLPRHERHYKIPRRRGQAVPSHCTGRARPVFLGYEFRTDVLLLRTTVDAPFIHDLTQRLAYVPLRDALTSLANALALTATSELDVDPRELQSGYRLQRTGSGAAIADVYLYDTLAGGAGYSRLIGQEFPRIFEATQARLAECSCESSCTECLRTYSNRFVHSSLDRRLALQLAAYCLRGEVPSLFSPGQQRAYSKPLQDMVELHGWSVGGSRDFGFELTRRGRRVTVGIVPALYDTDSLPDSWDSVLAFSVHEIEKDLPSCLLKLP